MANGLREVRYCVEPMEYLGRTIKVFLKERFDDNAAFNLMVTGCSPDRLDGFDDERLNIGVDIADIDFITRRAK